MNLIHTAVKNQEPMKTPGPAGCPEALPFPWFLVYNGTMSKAMKETILVCHPAVLHILVALLLGAAGPACGSHGEAQDGETGDGDAFEWEVMPE
jgi:hypothetical protein